jgi:hypothetical protein
LACELKKFSRYSTFSSVSGSTRCARREADVGDPLHSDDYDCAEENFERK